RRLLQIERAIAMGQAPRQNACALQSKVEFCSPEFEVVAPFSFRVDAERNCGKQVSARSGVCQIEDVLRGKQALVGIGWIACPIGVVAHCQSGGHAARQVGTDLGAGPARRVDENRSMTDVAVLRRASVVSVVGLRQTPDVVVADRLGISASNPYLIVESLAAI